MTRKFLVSKFLVSNLVISMILAIAGIGLASRPSVAAALAINADDDPAYDLGTKAMNDQRWSDAVLSFDQVIQAGGKKVDAALYWKAYSLNKLGKEELAADTCMQLGKQFKDSTWNEDCRVLKLAIGGAQNQSADPADPEPGQVKVPAPTGKPQRDPELEMKVLALNSVMRRDPAQGVPLVGSILTGDQPVPYKQHALFILAQSNSPQAQAMMRDLVLGKTAPTLQELAIRDCDFSQGKRLNDALVEAYQASNDVKVKHAVIAAFFTSGDDTRLVGLARQEKDLNLKRAIVSQLSLMQGKAATDYMMELLK